MTEVSKRTYEAMFIVDPTVASKEWNRVTEELEKTFSRYGAEIVSLKKWGERKLSYPIQKQQRGTYVLAYFNSPTDSLQKIRADLHLSEILLRCLILAHEGKVDAQEAPKNFETVGVVREGEAEASSSGQRPPPRRRGP
jgi:small subunit ribosomal protein S6